MRYTIYSNSSTESHSDLCRFSHYNIQLVEHWEHKFWMQSADIWVKSLRDCTEEVNCNCSNFLLLETCNDLNNQIEGGVESIGFA
jgi:hypothetical protein